MRRALALAGTAAVILTAPATAHAANGSQVCTPTGGGSHSIFCQTGPAGDSMKRYQVHHGDTLWSISIRFYGTPNRWHDIKRWNGITDVRALHAGQFLRLYFD